MGSQEQDLLQQVIVAEEGGDWKKIIDIYEQSVQETPDSINLQSGVILAHWRIGHKADAVKKLAAIAHSQSDNNDLLDNIIISWLAASFFVESMGWKPQKPEFITIAGLTAPDLLETKKDYFLSPSELQVLLVNLEAIITNSSQTSTPDASVGQDEKIIVSLCRRISGIINNFRNKNFETQVTNYVRFAEGMYYLGRKGPTADLFDTRQIPTLPDDYWTYHMHVFDASMALLAASIVLCAEGQPTPPSVTRWKQEITDNAMGSESLNNFLDVLSGSKNPNQNILPERAAKAIMDLEAGHPKLNKLFINHFYLIDALTRSTWYTFAAPAMEQLVITHWRHAVQHQGYDMVLPKVTKPQVETALKEDGRSGMAKAAHILLTVYNSVDVPMPKEALKMLSSLASSKTKK